MPTIPDPPGAKSTVEQINLSLYGFRYEDIPAEVHEHLEAAAEAWIRAGLPPGPAWDDYSSIGNGFFWPAERAWFAVDKRLRPAPPSPPVLPAVPVGPAVYRLFDEDDVLLYVGSSIKPGNRLTSHRHRTWGARIVRVEVEPCPTLEEARSREAAAILTEQPLMNVVGKGRLGR